MMAVQLKNDQYDGPYNWDRKIWVVSVTLDNEMAKLGVKDTL